MVTMGTLYRDRLLLSLIFAVLAGMIQSAEVEREITASRGKVTYLKAEHLHLLTSSHLCKIQVVVNDPMTQLAGTLYPKVFDCDFPSNLVKYTHYGSPLLDRDEVKLKVFRFLPTDTMIETISLLINIVDSPKDVFVYNPRLQELVISETSGVSDVIDQSILRFKYNYNVGAMCELRIQQNQRHALLAGRINKNRNRWDCREFLHERVQYKHSGASSPDKDYLPLAVEVDDPTQEGMTIEEYLFLPVSIDSAHANTPPLLSYLKLYVLDINEYTLRTVEPGVFTTSDKETATEKLIFRVTRPIEPETGYFVNLKNPNEPITSFLQQDLQAHNIAFHAGGVNSPLRKDMFVDFEVLDGHFAKSNPVTLHIVMRSSETRVPMIKVNKGMTLIEGQARPIMSKNLQIIDENGDDIRIYVKGGLRHGKLEMNGKTADEFTLADIRQGKVIYTHDGSDTEEDKLILRISNRKHSTRVKFHIVILPKDDSTPFLVTNEQLWVQQRSDVQISNNSLNGHDKDSDDADILYLIKTKPKYGQLLKRYKPLTTGYPVSLFSQRDLQKGYIYYQHLSNDGLEDSFELRLVNKHEPSNKSGKYSVSVNVVPVNDAPPQRVESTTHEITVRETDIRHITKEHLRYKDAESTEDNIMYTITSQPFFLTADITVDAGRIISTDHMSMLVKDQKLQALHSFSQSQINNGQIAFMPPVADTGPVDRHVRFIFAVSDTAGNKIIDQSFDITVLPVNNKVPYMSIGALHVHEGGAVMITTRDITAQDPDTSQSQLQFGLEDQPKHGHLMKNGLPLKTGSKFTIGDLETFAIKYVHDGSETERDWFPLSVSDGSNKLTKTVKVQVVPVDDQGPEVLAGLRREIQVREGSQVVLSTANLAATDNDTDDWNLVFHLLKSPQQGSILVDGRHETRFTQGDVWKRRVKFVHTSGEIGPTEKYDSAVFTVVDQSSLKPNGNSVLLDLNITIIPRDDSKPELLLGSPLFVTEGGEVELTREVLSAADQDTSLDDLTFQVDTPPRLGHIMLINRESELDSILGNEPIMTSSFTMADLKMGLVKYVQANHSGVEPVRDAFEVYVTDDIQMSAAGWVEINIIPRNDEKPQFEVADFEVEEGGGKILDPKLLSISDLDGPKSKLAMRVSMQPQHGNFFLVSQNQKRNKQSGVPLINVSASDLEHKFFIMYMHDGSETLTDRFSLALTDGLYIVTRTCNVTVLPVNDQVPSLLNNGGARVLEGNHVIITPDMLYAEDADTKEDELQYVVVRSPYYGILQLRSKEPSLVADDEMEEWNIIEAGNNFTQRDVNQNIVRYIYKDKNQIPPEDSFIFELTDGHNILSYDTFYITMPERLGTGLTLINNGLKVEEGDASVLGTESLSAADGYSKPQQLHFVIDSGPSQGYVAMVPENDTPIKKFTKSDLAAQNVIYVHTSKGDTETDSFEFTVSNANNKTSSGTFHIDIAVIDDILPTLNKNVPLTVVKGQKTYLRSTNLFITDPDTRLANLTYKVVDLPRHGSLLSKDDKIMESFTQLDIENENIAYKTDSSDEFGMDYFTFIVTDSHHNGYLVNGTVETKPTFYNILIQPPEKEPPKLLVNTRPDNLEDFGNGRFGFLISSKNLKATHPISENYDIVYIIVDKPERGYLHHMGTKRVLKRRFTQRDVDEEQVVFILDESSRGDNDSFTFRIQDAHRNTLDQRRFTFEWSVIEFSQAQYTVCEDAGRVPVTLVRNGKLNSSAFVEVRTKDMSAKFPQDYTLGSSNKIHFEQGVRTSAWELNVKNDGVKEDNEKFKVILKSPVNAVLGENSKAVIHIIDLHNGRCEEYLGMITKDKPHPAEGVDFPFGTDNDDIMINHPEASKAKGDAYNPYDSSSRVLDFGGFDIGQEMLKESRGSKNSKNDMFSSGSKGSSHPMKNYRDDRKKNKRGRRRNRKRSKPKETAKGGKMFVTPAPAPQLSTLAPQPCTQDTLGLLYFNLMSSKMYRCNGKIWETMGWGPNYLHAVMLRDPAPPKKPKGSTSTGNFWSVDKQKRCPNGWTFYEESCHKVLHGRGTWAEGESACVQSGGHLTHVDSVKHHEWLWKLTRQKSFWIGLTDSQKVGVWRFTNEMPLKFVKWRRGFPRTQRALGKNCVLVSRRGEWVNRPCNKNVARMVCSRPVRAKRRRRHRRIRS